MEFSSSEEVESDLDEDYKECEAKTKSPWQMRIQLQNTALTSDRFGIFRQSSGSYNFKHGVRCWYCNL